MNENHWPGWMANLDGRLSHREDILMFKTYILSEYDETFVLLVPASMNQGIGGLSFEHDIYMCINKKGVNAGK